MSCSSQLRLLEPLSCFEQLEIRFRSPLAKMSKLPPLEQVVIVRQEESDHLQGKSQGAA
jgi:hypothetical protein